MQRAKEITYFCFVWSAVPDGSVRKRNSFRLVSGGMPGVRESKPDERNRTRWHPRILWRHTDLVGPIFNRPVAFIPYRE